AIEDEQLMPDQHGLGDNGTESTRPPQSGQGDDEMNENDSEVAHPGNGINTSQTTALRPIWQFAIDRHLKPHDRDVGVKAGTQQKGCPTTWRTTRRSRWKKAARQSLSGFWNSFAIVSSGVSKRAKIPTWRTSASNS